MIRTSVVELSTIDGVAYRTKLPAGGSGIVILTEGEKQPGIASISKTSGEAIPAKNNPKGVYPQEAFDEAIALTTGLPYKKLGPVKYTKRKAVEEAPEAASEPEEVVVDSAEYEKIVEKYTDKNGKLSYELLNKDMIKFLHSSSTARQMVADQKTPEEIRLYVAGSKFRSITGNHELTDEQVEKIAELLDEVYPKGVFKEFNDEIRKGLAAAK